MLAAVLLTLAGAAAPTPQDRAGLALALATDFCLTAETMTQKATRLRDAEWIERAGTASAGPQGDGAMRVFANEAATGTLVVLTYSASDEDRVVNCMVDGRDLDVEALIGVAYPVFRPLFGEPVQEGATVAWNLPQLQRVITLAPARVLNHENRDRAFMIHVRLTPVS